MEYTKFSTLLYYIATLSFMSNVDGIETEGDMLYLGNCLSFFTGASQIPPTGFDIASTLNFNSINIYPTASTCALTLTLPTKYHSSYLLFKEKVLFAFCNHGGFGLC